MSVGRTPPLGGVCRALGLDPADVRDVRPLAGGRVHRAARVRAGAHRFFLKWNPAVDHEVFDFEAEGLDVLARAGPVAAPAVAARSRPGDSVAWLALEWIEGVRGDAAGWRRLGRDLAALHRRASGVGGFGWRRDNAIGPLPQPNGRMERWGDFWAERRILPLAGELAERGVFDRSETAVLEEAAERARSLLESAADVDGPSLLHGDLWSGNVMFRRSGKGTEGVLVDPAVYVGHREVDLAMCRRFGGFPQEFFDAYADAWPLQAGLRRRMPAYHLYADLVHARLFGGGYPAAALRSAASVVRVSTA